MRHAFGLSKTAKPADLRKRWRSLRSAAVAVIRAPGQYPVGQLGTEAMTKNSIAETARSFNTGFLAGKMPAQNVCAQNLSALGRIVARVSLIVGLAGVMAACQTARFGGQPERGVVRDLEPGPSAPSGIVMAEPLGAPGSDEIDDFPEMEPRMSGDDDRQQTAALSEPAQQRSRLSRTSLVGSWNASEPGGGSCRVTLSSTPALDLYRASASGCTNQEVASVNAWDLRGSEVYLYKQGGAVAARLQASRGSMNGAISQSGAPLTMSR